MLEVKRGSYSWKAFWTPKRGNQVDEYEDAFAADAEAGRFAIADGASESSFAGLWAQLLVGGFVHAKVKEDSEERDWLATQQQRWLAKVNQMELPWYAEEKRQMGAFATFLGLMIRRSRMKGAGRWKAVAVGDSCLFQVRKDRLVGSFPLGRHQAFGTHPALIGSRPAKGKASIQRQKLEWGKWKTGDRIFLMTDAMAHWFLQRNETQRKPWQSLTKRLADPKADEILSAYIEKLRDEQEMRNDDVTLVCIQFA